MMPHSHERSSCVSREDLWKTVEEQTRRIDRLEKEVQGLKDEAKLLSNNGGVADARRRSAGNSSSPADRAKSQQNTSVSSRPKSATGEPGEAHVRASHAHYGGYYHGQTPFKLPTGGQHNLGVNLTSKEAAACGSAKSCGREPVPRASRPTSLTLTHNASKGKPTPTASVALEAPASGERRSYGIGSFFRAWGTGEVRSGTGYNVYSAGRSVPPVQAAPALPRLAVRLVAFPSIGDEEQANGQYNVLEARLRHTLRADANVEFLRAGDQPERNTDVVVYLYKQQEPRVLRGDRLLYAPILPGKCVQCPVDWTLPVGLLILLTQALT